MRAVQKLATGLGTGFFILLAPITAATVGDIYVDDSHTGPFLGTSTNPYKQIKDAFTSPAVSGDVIHVASGTYNAALGETFPIELPSGVTLEGPTSGSLPQIGGDLIDQSVPATELILVDATAGNASDIEIRRLHFLGEDETGEDSPIAFKVLVANGYEASGILFEHNECERPVMKDSGVQDESTILVETGYGVSTVTVLDCIIEASNRGGIEYRIGSDTTQFDTAAVNVNVQRNVIDITGTETAVFGFAFRAEGEAWGTADLLIRGLNVDSSAKTENGGIQDGIQVFETLDDGSFVIDHESFELSSSKVKSCLGQGIHLKNVSSGSANAYLGLWSFERNQVTGCGGAGLYIQHSESSGGTGEGYITVKSKGNLFASNQKGVKIRDEDNSGGSADFTNDTIANNSSYGLEMIGDYATISSLTNCIVWGNAGGSDEYYADTSGWDPTDGSAWGTRAEFCDFEGIGGGQGNFSSNPRFVNAGALDFHIDGSYPSPCLDTGDNSPDSLESLTQFDIDGDDRVIDGDDDDRPQVDVGFDEYEP